MRKIAEQQYEIIAGERRWRAAQLAGVQLVPCLIKDVPDNAAVAIALIENIQREDLNAMEEAIALERLMQEFELTHQQVADAVGKSRATVSNLLRLNNLEPFVKTMLEHGDLDMGHARALLILNGEQQIAAGKMVSAKGLSVRETEKLVKRVLNPNTKPKPKPLSENLDQWQTNLSKHLGAKVDIKCNDKGKGKLVINYQNLDELERVINQINK